MQPLHLITSVFLWTVLTLLASAAAIPLENLSALLTNAARHFAETIDTVTRIPQSIVQPRHMIGRDAALIESSSPTTRVVHLKSADPPASTPFRGPFGYQFGPGPVILPLPGAAPVASVS